MKMIVHIDLANLAFRCHYKAPHLSWNGRLTGAIYESIKSLLMLKREYRGAHFICAFDSRSERRHAEVHQAMETGILVKDDGYKANRNRSSEGYLAVIKQIDEMLALLSKTPIQVVKIPGAEADDIIGAYCHQLTDHRHLIFSSDRDFYQLLKENVRIYEPMKKIEINEATIQEKFGLKPLQLIDVGAFSGDNSDNIPGVDGVGPKTALALIQKWGSIEAAVEGIKAKKISGEKMKKFEDNVLASEAKLKLCKSLKRIDTGINVPPVDVDVKVDRPYVENYLVENLGCKSLAPQMDLLFAPSFLPF